MLDLLISPRRFFRGFDPSFNLYALATIGHFLAQLANDFESFVGGPDPQLAYVLVGAIPRAVIPTALITIVWLFLPTRMFGGRLTMPRTYAISGLAALLPSASLSAFLLHILPHTQTSTAAFYFAIAGCACCVVWGLCLVAVAVKEVAGLSWFKSVVVATWPIALILAAVTWIWATEGMNRTRISDMSYRPDYECQAQPHQTPNTSFQRTQTAALFGPLNSNR